MVNVVIDGKNVSIDKNKSVLQGALDAGIYIPHLCHHPNLNDIGACRMCIVKVDGGIKTSCTLKAEEGMEIETDSEEINRLRMLALELLLSCHPEDCSTCPKFGNCELQVLIQYIGPKTGRLKMRTKGFTTETANPLLIHDMNRCILCGRCVRACNELRGSQVLDYKKKGLESYISTIHQKLLIDDNCRFCGACAEVCPTGSIIDKFREASKSDNKEYSIVPCKGTCPAHTDIPRYIRYAKEGKFDESAAVIREKLPFPKALGHICNHACEYACKRGDVSDSMAIREIKRYVAERDSGKYWKEKGRREESTGKKVCVVGAGPAGMTAAYYLGKKGHEVTIKEALDKVGGMMRYGIPAYRLPRHIVDEEYVIIDNFVYKLETNAKVEDPKSLLKDFDAVLVAIGAHQGNKLPMEGSDLKGVILNIDFLRNASMGLETGIGKRVVVLGGGNVAFDCARTAKRLGAEEVHVACLETMDKMTADDIEIEEALEEGIFVHPAKTFERICGEERVSGIDFMNVKSFTFDEKRRPIIEKEENSQIHIDADTIIFAVGQRPDIGEDWGFNIVRGNLIEVSKNLSTNLESIFAAGDVIYGTKSVIMAIESGREVASAIDLYLGGDGDISEILAPVDEASQYIGSWERFGYEKRAETFKLEVADRVNNFDLVDHGLCDGNICFESARCLQCDLRLKIEVAKTWQDFSDVREKSL